jgi:CRP/FNR family cyclic AMP-dependent transcriptional regulator
MEVKHTVEYEDGELILMEGGESDRNIYVLLEGQARVTKETDKGQVTLALLEEGDIFGEVSFLAQKYGARSATIAARGKVKIGVLDQERLSTEYGTLSPLFQKILKDLAERFSTTTVLASRLAARRMEKPSLERRAAKRNPLQKLRIKVEYVSETDGGRGTLSGSESYQGILLDMAKTGMGLALYTTSYSESTHSLGAKFIFQFTLHGKPMVRVPGHIVWARAMGGKKARMGVEFSETNPYLRKLIEEFLQTVADQ